MLTKIKKISFGLLLLLLCQIAVAGLEGTWRFTPISYSVTNNGFTQSWTLDEYLSQFGQLTGVTADDFIFEEEYSDSWLTPQTYNSDDGGVSYSSTIRYTFSSDTSGIQTTDFTSTVFEPTSGQNISSSGHLEYAMVKISGSGDNGNNSGNPTSTSNVADRINNVAVSNIQGSVFEVTPTSTTAVDNSITDNSTIFTAANSSLEVNLGNNNLLTIAENTLVTLSPEVSASSLTNNKKASLLRGSVDYKISQGGSTAFEVITPVVSIKVLASTKRAAEQTNFNAQYSQTGTSGSSTISVTSGSVQVTNRNGNTTTLSAGQEQTFASQVKRTSWVQPADSAYLFGGKTNTLAWMSYPGAVGYIIEYTFPSPAFAEDNPSSMEFPEKKVLIPAANFQLINDIAVMEMFLPASLNGSIVEARLFPVDGQGNILNNSVSSDKGTFGFKAQ